MYKCCRKLVLSLCACVSCCVLVWDGVGVLVRACVSCCVLVWVEVDVCDCVGVGVGEWWYACSIVYCLECKKSYRELVLKIVFKIYLVKNNQNLLKFISH